MSYYDDVVKYFISKVNEIKAEQPAYKQPGDGSNGTCDCIGLIIGAIRRMGLSWTGIHGSNWAARREVVKLQKINNVKELEVGDIVLKAYKQGEKGWNLPTRYRKGGKYYNGDLQDYYHAGVVTSVNPLIITHMSSPSVKVDTKLGKWAYHGKITILTKASDIKIPGNATQVPSSSSGDLVALPTIEAAGIVAATSGKYVKMRQYPSTSCRTWVNVPVGAKVEIVMPGETWTQINYGKRKGWYMMAKYINVLKGGF